MSRKYKFAEKESLYFISFAIVYWIDLFIRLEYKDVIIDSWNYCIEKKGLELYGWCIMSSHIHMIISSHQDPLENIMRDMKSHTSRQLKSIISDNSNESRKDWLLSMMEEPARK